MPNFSQIFSDQADLYKELTTRAGNPVGDGQLLQIDTTAGVIVGYDLVSGVGTTEVVTETTETAVLDLSVVPSFGASGSTTSSTITYTSTATDTLTDSFSAGDLIYFSGTFSATGNAINAAGTSQGYTPQAAFGTGDYIFAFPIHTITGSSGSWTIVLNLNEPPFKAWQESSTDALVTAHSTQGASYPSANQTEIFFATAVLTGNLDVSLRTTTQISSVEINQYADGDLEIAGINADGVIVNLTQGDFGTAGQAVLVNPTADGLVFGSAGTDHSTLAASTVPLNNAGQTAFVDSVITQSSTENEGTTFNTVIIASGEGEGAAQNSLNVNGTTINTSGAVSGVSLSTQTASVDITTLAGGSSPSALIYRAGIVQPINLGANGQVLAVDTSLNPTSLRWTDLPTAGVGTITEETSTTERDFSVSTPFTGEYQSSFTDVFNAGDTSDFTLEVGGTNQSGNAWSTTNLTLRGNQAAANGFWGTGNVTGGNPNNWNFGDHVALFVSATQYALYTVDSSAGLSNWNLTHVTSMGVIPSAGASVTIGVANSAWPPFASFTQIDGDLTVSGGITGNLALDTLAQTTNNGDGTFNADGTVASTTNYKIEVVPANTTVTTPLANTIYLHLES